MIKSTLLASLTALMIAPMAANAYPTTQLDIALIALASKVKKSNVNATYNALRQQLPNQSATDLWNAAEYIHREVSGRRTENTVQNRQGRRR